MRARVETALFVFLLQGVFAASVMGQTGTIAGRVTDAETGDPVVQATVQALVAGRAETGALTDDNGQFQITAEAGTYALVVDFLGYTTARIDGVRVTAGATETVSIELRSTALVLNPIVVTASRREEKALDAPAHVSVVSTEEIAERTAISPVDHVRGQPGMDVAQTGLQQANFVTRGFNNVFSGALLVMTDNRYARVPSLRVNVPYFVANPNLDLERIEVVLGPGAALYGPNSASGVLHLITTSPIDAPGTQFSIAAGEQSVFQSEFRHASKINDRMGIKISGQYLQGDDWRFVDPIEAQLRALALETDPDTKIGDRNYDVARYGGEVRFDARPWDDGEIILSAGLSTAVDGIELTGLGAGQVKDWRYSYFQTRVRKDRFFGQFFANLSESGDTFLLRTGNPIVDESHFFAGQLQHGRAIGERLDFIYGLDVQRTNPRTEGTITGSNEDDDTINEVGGYLHSLTNLGKSVDLVGALRLDWHSELEDPVFSPRAALVWRPVPEQNLRLTFNRAFSTPTTNNLFLDLVSGSIPISQGIGYDVRTRGTPESGFTWNERCPGGFNDLCMYSPFVPGAQLPANAALAWNTLLQALAPPELAPLLPFLQSDNPQVDTLLRRFDRECAQSASDCELFPVDPFGPTEIARMEPTITQTIEVGYKGLIGNRILLAGDVYYSDITDFIGPLNVETPSVFFEPTSVATFITQQLTPLVQAGELTPQQLAALVQQTTQTLAMVPIGTVAPDQNPNSDLLLAYRNFGDFDLWGFDVAGEVLLTDNLALRGTYSFVSEECVDFDNDGLCTSVVDVALNAPQNKGTVGLRYSNTRAGFTAEGRVRITESFPMNSGEYVGTVDSYTVFDANLSYGLGMFPGATIGVTATNLFDDEHTEFIGAPEIGRLVMVRFKYDLP